MPANVVAILLVIAGLGIARIICRPLSQPLARALTIWLCAAVLHFLTAADPIITLGVTAILMAVLAPTAPPARVAFFLIAAPCLPDTLVWIMRPPGIENLGVVNQYKFAAIVVLLPLLSRKEVRQQPISLPEFGLFIYCLVTAATHGAATNLTSGLRFFLLDQVLAVLVPFVVIRRTIRDAQDFSVVLNAWVVVSVILASMALLATMKQWDFYRYYEPYSNFNQPIYRYGLQRIATTTSSHSLAYHLAAAVLIVEYFRNQSRLKLRSALYLQLLLLAGIFFSQSRGAATGLVIGLIVMLIMRIESAGLRRTGYGLIAICCAVGGAYLTLSDQTENDPYGTFKYRQELLETALEYILAHPFGDYNALLSPSFERLRQGQGIIDITNLYLLIALYYGIPITVVFIGIIAWPVFQLSKRPSGVAQRSGGLLPASAFSRPTAGMMTPTEARSARFARNAAGPLKQIGTSSFDGGEAGYKTTDIAVATRATIAGVIVGWLFLVVTTSDVGLTIHIGIVFAALAWSCLSRGRAAAQRRSQAHPAMRPARPTRGVQVPNWSSRRISMFDYAKGLGIILVVAGHAIRGLVGVHTSVPTYAIFLDHWIYVFHMPLFFFLSGLFIERSASRSLDLAVIDKVKSIAYPYFAWSIVTESLRFVSTPNQSFPDFWTIFVTPLGQYWFLYVLFIFSIAYIVLRKLKVDRALILLWSIFFFATGVLEINLGDWGVAYMSRLNILYFAVGAFVGPNILIWIFEGQKPYQLLISGAAALVILVVPAGSGPIDVNSLGFAWAFVGIFGALSIAKYLEATSRARLLEFIGQRSLEIFVAHTIFSSLTRVILKQFKIDKFEFQLIMVFIAGIAGPLLLLMLMERWRISYLFAATKSRARIGASEGVSVGAI